MSLKIKTPITNAKRIKLTQLFSDVGREMAASFKTLSSVSHGPTKGSGEESVWIEWLQRYLPRRYAVGSGFITDSKGDQSLQQDIIIYDRQYSPLLYVQSEVMFVPTECVYAVLEVKTKLDATQIKDAAKKIMSVKGLLRLPAQPVPHAGGLFPPQDRGQIFGYVVAASSTWTTKGSWSGLQKNLEKNYPCIDGGCVLDAGAFSTGIQSENSAIQTVVNKKQSLFGFFGLLLEDIKTLGTTPPWDLSQYSDAIKALRANRAESVKFKSPVKPSRLP